jgi:peptidoglycan/xylan/chitin deacetylase (PgdA/CDA1 family)
LKLPHHGRYGYSAIVKRPDYHWPEGKRLAIYIAVNIEHFAFGKGLGHMVSAENPPPDQRAYAWRDYGNRVGVWRFLEMLDGLGLPACHLMNTAIFDFAPEILDAVLARGDEIVAHGRTNAEGRGLLWEEDERQLLASVRDTIEKRTGQTPRGWLTPWVHESDLTPDLLQETGYKYVMNWPFDDQPVWMKTREGRIMAMPYSQDLNDSTQILFHHHTPEAFAAMIVDRFDEMLRQSAKQPLVTALPFHPMISAQPHRIGPIRRALEHIANHPEIGKVWFTRPGAIYEHCAALSSGVVPE